MNMLKLSRATALLGGVAAAALACGQAQAQTAANGQQTTLGEVVVTALRREQRLQDVPAAITTLSADDIKAKGAQDLRDYLTTVPGVTYSENNLRGMRVSIRGISDGLGVTDPLAGIYVDETPISETFQSTLDPDIYDIERVEVLKGPQGTLYGAGSMGGTVRIITHKPQLGVYEGSVEGSVASVDHGGDNRRIDGMVNVPLFGDKAALRVSAGYRKDGGWIDDLVRKQEDANTVEKKNARAQLLLKPADDTSIILGFLYQKEDLGLPSFNYFVGKPVYESNRVFKQAGASETRLYSLTVHQDWEKMSLTSASNFLSKSTFNSNDVTSSLRPIVQRLAGKVLGPSEGIGLDTAEHVNLFTQEVRLASSGHNRFDWLVGGFYSDLNIASPQFADVSQAPTLTGFNGAFILNSLQHYGTRQVATFGEVTWNVTDQLSVTGGLRVFDVSRRNTNVAQGLLAGGSVSTDLEASLSSSTKKILVKYEHDRDHMLYAQAAQGYRNGGANAQIPASTCGPALAAAGYSSAPLEYGPDRLWNYELGSKNALFDGRMQLNAAAFYIDWSNIQSSIGLSCGSSFVTNAGKAVSKGLELETAARPLQGLSLTASASYIDAKLTSVAPGVVASIGDRLPLTAKWSWNAAAQYDRDVGAGFTGFARGEVNYVGDRWNMFRGAGARAVLMGAYTTLNARIGVRTNRWSAAIFGTNLTDKRIISNVTVPTFELVGQPRTVGVTLSANF